MTKDEALAKGYCKHCAGFVGTLQLCGVTLAVDTKHMCSLPADVIERWKGEHGLEREPIRRPGGRKHGS